MQSRLKIISVAIVLILALSGCKESSLELSEENLGAKALAMLFPVTGHTAIGTVTFTQVPKGIRVHAQIANLRPGRHGFHIHEYGNCSGNVDSSAGGHFDPYGNTHGDRIDIERHVGDLGNIIADSTGTVDTQFVDGIISFTGMSSIVGRSVIVDTEADDFVSSSMSSESSPAACGVIGRVRQDSEEIPLE